VGHGSRGYLVAAGAGLDVLIDDDFIDDEDEDDFIDDEDDFDDDEGLRQ
jgi:hypothetical protein